MTIVNRRRMQAIAVFWMLLGTAVVFLMLLLMNHFSDHPQQQDREYTASFEVKKPRVTPQKREKVQKKVKRRSRVAPPQMLDLGSDIAGIDLGLPAFSVGDMGDSGLLGNTDNAVMSGDMVDTAARAVSRSPVEYPRRAKAKDIEGYVVISLLIDKQGRVKTARVIEAEPTGVFETRALQTVKSWIFEPARYKGRPVDSWANQTIRFELS